MRKPSRALSLVPLLVLLSYAQAIQTPQQLSDETFWKFIEEASEPTQEFPGENFVSNEPRYPAAIRLMK